MLCLRELTIANNVMTNSCPMSRVGGRSFDFFATCESQHYFRHSCCSFHNATLPTKQVTLSVALHTIAIKQTHYRTDYTSTSKQRITLMSERHAASVTPLPLAFGGWLRADANVSSRHYSYANLLTSV